VPRKEVRYLTAIIPFLAMTVAYSLVYIYRKIREHPKPVITPKAFVVLCIILIVLPMPPQLHIERAPTFENEIQQIISERGIMGMVLTSDPALVSFVEQPIVTLDGMEFAPKIYEREKDNYELLFVNYCDLNCPPDSLECQEARKELLVKMHNNNEELFTKQFKFKKTGRTCTYKIYVPK
jgi:hypothetical protein